MSIARTDIIYTWTTWTKRVWTDDRAWIGEWRSAVGSEAKAGVLDSWVTAAGGRIENGAAVLPPLPRQLATIELHRMLRQSGIHVIVEASS